jgi:NAD(P)-dependent dehydrogenase (short-subunit alcohol dehydrogenase family)
LPDRRSKKKRGRKIRNMEELFMATPSLAEPRSGRRLEGRHVTVFGAGTANSFEKGRSLCRESKEVFGVGQATALVSARHGAVASCVDVNIENASRTVDLINREGGLALVCDATLSDSVKHCVEPSLAYDGGIDVLHNNFCIARTGGPVECPEDGFDQVLVVNVKSIYLAHKWTLPAIQGSGLNVHISSSAANRFIVPWINYAASK